MNALELFQFVVRSRHERGWGRALRSAVAHWYNGRPAAEVAADMLKCPEYEGWTHRDLLRMAHPEPATPAHNALFQWAVDGELGHLAMSASVAGELKQVYAVDRLKRTNEEREALSLVEEFDLTPEMVPAEWKNSAAVWESLLTGMSYTDIVENLAALADSGLLVEESPASALVVARLIDRRGVARSGLSRADIARAREAYARHRRALDVVIDALETAEELAQN